MQLQSLVARLSKAEVAITSAARSVLSLGRGLMLKPKSEGAFCHMASAKKGDVWTQFYPLLDN